MSETTLDTPLTVLELKEFALALEDLEETFGIPESFFEEHDREVLVLRDAIQESMIALESLQQVGGVSQAIAMTFEHLLPEGYPLRSFTRLPTQTNYRALTISLEERNWGLIVGLGVAIVSLIARIVMWIFDRKDGKDFGKIDETAIRVAKRIKELEAQYPAEAKKAAQEVDEHFKDTWHQLNFEACVNPSPLLKNIFDQGEAVYVHLLETLKNIASEFKTARTRVFDDAILNQLLKNNEALNKQTETLAKAFEGNFCPSDGDGVSKLTKTIQAIKEEIDKKNIEKASEALEIHKFASSKERDSVGIYRYVRSSRGAKFWNEKTLTKSEALFKKIGSEIEEANKAKEQVVHEASDTEAEKNQRIIAVNKAIAKSYNDLQGCISAVGVYTGIRQKIKEASVLTSKAIDEYHKKFPKDKKA